MLTFSSTGAWTDDWACFLTKIPRNRCLLLLTFMAFWWKLSQQSSCTKYHTSKEASSSLYTSLFYINMLCEQASHCGQYIGRCVCKRSQHSGDLSVISVLYSCREPSPCHCSQVWVVTLPWALAWRAQTRDWPCPNLSSKQFSCWKVDGLFCWIVTLV